MFELVIAYIITTVIFLALDFVWLTRIAQPFYFSRLGHLLRERPRIGVAAAFYAVYVLGIMIFALSPALRTGSSEQALLYGALFGFFAYATYNITNLATLKDWPQSVTFVDIAWGTTLTGLSAFIGFVGTQWVIALL